MQAEQGLWSAMQSHTDEATVANRTPFLFVDLTAAHCLPMWLTPDQIGGKFHLRDDQEWALHGGQTITNLQELGRALKSATASTRFFRSVSQWNGAFKRYAVVAVAAKQLSWPDVLSHADIVMQLAEQERLKGRPPYLAFVYEEIVRKSFARRAEKRDPDLKISQEIQRVDKDILDIARHRLTDVLKDAGMDGHSEASVSSAKMSMTTEALLNKHTAATEAARRQTEQVPKQLLETQQMILDKGRAAAADGKGDGRKGNPANLTPSKRQLKTQAWIEKGQARRRAQAERKDGKTGPWHDRRY